MSRLLKSWIALAALVTIAPSTQALAWPCVNHIIASTATHRWVYLSAGWHSLGTQNLSPGADPVLHVWGPRYSGPIYIGDGELGHDDPEDGAPPTSPPPPPPAVDPAVPCARARRAALDAFERAYAQALLASHGGKVTVAAEVAGLNRVYLHQLLRRHGLR